MGGSDVKSVVERLARRGPFGNRQVATELKVSRQAVHKQLRLMVERGELEVVGQGRSARYQRVNQEGQLRGVASGSSPASVFWKELVSELRATSYVELFPVASHFSTRAEARKLLDDCPMGNRVIVDFHGVSSVTPAFADELFNAQAWANALRLQAINAAASVEAEIVRALLKHQARTRDD
ncbi:MAG: STAS-like domain-containing protein [Myxococcota bacterium]